MGPITTNSSYRFSYGNELVMEYVPHVSPFLNPLHNEHRYFRADLNPDGTESFSEIFIYLDEIASYDRIQSGKISFCLSQPPEIPFFYTLEDVENNEAKG